MKPSATADFDQRYQTHLTYRWRDIKTKKMAARTVSGAAFLWLPSFTPVELGCF